MNKNYRHNDSDFMNEFIQGLTTATISFVNYDYTLKRYLAMLRGLSKRKTI